MKIVTETSNLGSKRANRPLQGIGAISEGNTCCEAAEKPGKHEKWITPPEYRTLNHVNVREVT